MVICLKQKIWVWSKCSNFMNEARLLVGLQGLAGASAAVQNAWAYANERTQGSSSINPEKKASIIEFPDAQDVDAYEGRYRGT